MWFLKLFIREFVEVNINGQQFDSSEEFSFSIGENVSINISLCNCSSKSLKSLCLWIQCYQDFQNDQRKFGLLNKKDICGFDRVIIDEVSYYKSNKKLFLIVNFDFRLHQRIVIYISLGWHFIIKEFINWIFNAQKSICFQSKKTVQDKNQWVILNCQQNHHCYGNVYLP